MKILITGGAGFIGSHLARYLLNKGHDVCIFDSFNPQIHGDSKVLAEPLFGNVDLIIGDIRDKEAFSKALDNQEIIVHLAAETGTGQSMYEIQRYESTNIQGTAILFDHLINSSKRTINKVVVASSRSIYGEGKYHCQVHDFVYPNVRKKKDLLIGQYEPTCPICDEKCSLVETDEDSKIHPTSFYGLTKQVQEQMTLMFARTMGISGFALRYQNVYGPGQSLNNPYTGILAIFANQARENKPINVFEDGKESRDFVYIDDVVEATYQAIMHEEIAVKALNVGSGHRVTVHEVAEQIVRFFGSESTVEVTGAFREGDIRHSIASLHKVKEVLGFLPRWNFENGINEFLKWANNQQHLANLGYEESLIEMKQKGLFYGN
jgi:dTDP-L-rhamnose 4-epimerase